jgi:hypothetical protein
MLVSCFNDCRSKIHPLLGALFIVVNLHVISSKVAIENSSLLDALVCNGIFLFLSCHHLNTVYLLKRCAYFSFVPSGIHSCVNIHSISELTPLPNGFLLFLVLPTLLKQNKTYLISESDLCVLIDESFELLPVIRHLREPSLVV